MKQPEEITPTGAEKINPYRKDSASKTKQVKRMFNKIAPAYDGMNNMMSFGMHGTWRNKALDMADIAIKENEKLFENFPHSPLRILDIATGTGEVAIELAHRYDDAIITGADLSEGMLKIAEAKLKKLPSEIADRIHFETADCLRLPYEDNEFDFVTVAYGVRNFEFLEKGLKEIHRVLQPGGVLCVVELSRPENFFTRLAYDIYSNYMIPVIGYLASGDRHAYKYLPQSIAAAPQRIDMAQLMRNANLKRCRWKSLSMGAVTLYVSQKIK